VNLDSLRNSAANGATLSSSRRPGDSGLFFGSQGDEIGGKIHSIASNGTT